MYIRSSADFRTSSAVIPQCAHPMPKLAPTRIARPSTRIGWMISLRRRTARSCGVGPAETVGEDHELVTAEPGHRVAVAHGPAEPPGHLDQHRVPGVVPEAVVDRLEAVEVAEEDREPLRPVVLLALGGDRVDVVVVRAVHLGGGAEVETVAVHVVRLESAVRHAGAGAVVYWSCVPKESSWPWP